MHVGCRNKLKLVQAIFKMSPQKNLLRIEVLYKKMRWIKFNKCSIVGAQFGDTNEMFRDSWGMKDMVKMERFIMRLK